MIPFDVRAVVFLGNPGKEFDRTRHNAGWMFAENFPWDEIYPWQNKFKGRWTTGFVTGKKLHALMPRTFMNLSGESVRAMSDFFDLSPETWLVVHDEIELPLGEVRLQKGGGTGGHNGLRSLKAHWGSSEFFRLRLGVGRPVHGDVASFVLGKLTPEEEAVWPEILGRAAQLLVAALQTGSLS